MNPIESGQTYKWLGLPGQYATDRLIRIGSMTATCKINATIIDPSEPDVKDSASLITIPAADFETAVRRGWLLLVEDTDAAD